MPATGEFQFPTLGSTAQDTTVNAAVKARYEANSNGSLRHIADNRDKQRVRGGRVGARVLGSVPCNM